MRNKNSSVGIYPTVDGISLGHLISKEYPELNVVVAKEVRFLEDILPAIESGRELCTIRYEPDMNGSRSIVIPETVNNKVNLAYYDADFNVVPYGMLEIPMVVVANVAEFPYFAMAAENGGHVERDHVIDNISQIYHKKLGGRPLRDDDYLTGFFMSRVIKD